MSWKVYSVSSCSPDNLVEVLDNGDGIAAKRWRFRYMSSDLNFAVESWIAGHSRVTDVWVTFRSYATSIQ